LDDGEDFDKELEEDSEEDNESEGEEVEPSTDNSSVGHGPRLLGDSKEEAGDA
jgi:hypothetical protein